MKKIYLFFILILITTNVFAGAPPPTPGEDVPITDNLFILLIAGIGYGLYMFSPFKKKSIKKSKEKLKQ